MAALLEAKVSLASIMDQEKCSRAFIYNVKGLVEAGHGFQRQKGSGWANKKRTMAKFGEILAKIQEKPDISLASLGKATTLGLWNLGQFGEEGLPDPSQQCQ